MTPRPTCFISCSSSLAPPQPCVCRRSSSAVSSTHAHANLMHAAGLLAHPLRAGTSAHSQAAGAARRWMVHAAVPHSHPAAASRCSTAGAAVLYRNVPRGVAVPYNTARPGAKVRYCMARLPHGAVLRAIAAVAARSSGSSSSSSSSVRFPRHRACGHAGPIHATSHLHQTEDAACSRDPHPTSTDWAGLRQWRAAPVDVRRGWGKAGPCASLPAPGAREHAEVPLAASLVECALQVLQTASPTAKAALTHRAWTSYCQGSLPLHAATAASTPTSSPPTPGPSPSHTPPGSSALTPPSRPSRPPLPRLVAPRQVPSPGCSALPLPAHMLHNLAHIELNAIDLAWDTVARFAPLQLPPSFYADFARVADDESRHLGWCLQRMAELGHSYGDMEAHDLLWEGAQMSSSDLNARLAIIPLSQEARGLDAGSRLVAKLTGAGDKRSAAVVAAITVEERAHVAVGAAWFKRVCTALELPEGRTFRTWLSALCPDLLKGPFNHQERALVGLPRDWYDVDTWPSEERQHMVLPAAAASIRGAGGRLAPRSGPQQQQQLQQQQQQQQQLQRFQEGGGCGAAPATALAEGGTRREVAAGVESDRGSGCEGVGVMPQAPPPLSREQLTVLRERLAFMLQREEECSG